MNEVVKKKIISVVWQSWNGGYDPCGRSDEDRTCETFKTKKEAEAFIQKLKVNANPSRIELVETTKKTTVVYKQ